LLDLNLFFYIQEKKIAKFPTKFMSSNKKQFKPFHNTTIGVSMFSSLFKVLIFIVLKGLEPKMSKYFSTIDNKISFSGLDNIVRFLYQRVSKIIEP